MAEETTEPNKLGSINPETEPKADIPNVEEKRKPGRPPKAATTATVLNTDTNYTPSPERNNADQAAQPTGTGTSAGWGDDLYDEADLADADDWRPIAVDGRLASLIDKKNDSPPPIQAAEEGEKLFPVRMLRNYRPASDRWYPLLNNGKLGRQPRNTDGTGTKVMKGYTIVLPLSEARQVVQRGIGERADALPQ